jgi:hypothetical protein
VNGQFFSIFSCVFTYRIHNEIHLKPLKARSRAAITSKQVHMLEPKRKIALSIAYINITNASQVPSYEQESRETI